MFDRRFMTYSDDQFQALKKPRVSEKMMNSTSRMPISSTNRSKQAKSTKPVCLQFRRGKCNYGVNCIFAHNVTGVVGELNPNRGNILSEAGHEIIGRKLCWRFMCGKGCPYGDKCVFIHPNVKHVEGGLSVARENAAVPRTLVNAGPGAGVGGGYRRRCDESCRGFKNLNYDASQMQQKKVFWKTMPCRKWERFGSCSYGVKCHFAHGAAEIQKLGFLPSLESDKALAVESLAIVSNGAVSSNKEFGTLHEQQEKDKKCLIRLNDIKKISRIYADWIDTVPY